MSQRLLTKKMGMKIYWNRKAFVFYIEKNEFTDIWLVLTILHMCHLHKHTYMVIHTQNRFAAREALPKMLVLLL